TGGRRGVRRPSAAEDLLRAHTLRSRILRMTSLPYAATERPDGDGARSPGVHHDRTLRSMARGGAAAFAGTGAAAVLGFVLTVVVTRALAPDDAGAFFSSIAIFFVL